jgi:transketolase
MTTDSSAATDRRGRSVTRVPDHVRRLHDRLSGDEKHDPAATSTLDVLWVLYSRVLRVDPRRPERPDRDRFVLSKGHGPASYYAVLAAVGFFDPDDLGVIGGRDSRLGSHPDRDLVPGVEVSTGSLGHGLAVAVGMALAMRARSNPARVIVLCGDAELNEGSTWEALHLAAHERLTALTVVVVDNRSRSWPVGSWRGSLAAAGWQVLVVPGRDHEALAAALAAPAETPADGHGPVDRPVAVLAEVRP